MVARNLGGNTVVVWGPLFWFFWTGDIIFFSSGEIVRGAAGGRETASETAVKRKKTRI
jgi:hypothetical protein